MKIYIASDIHGNFTAAKALVDAFTAGNGDKLIVLGDVYNHGPKNPVNSGYAPLLVRELLNSVKDKLVVIKGNCDSDVDRSISEFEFYKSYTMSNLNKTLFFTHGDQFNLANPPELPEGSLVFHGHFHQHTDATKHGIRYLNPGSIGIPFDGACGYFVLDTDDNEPVWFELEI